jgi:hypothetical protein
MSVDCISGPSLCLMTGFHEFWVLIIHVVLVSVLNLDRSFR